jgi:hypothetical protein
LSSDNEILKTDDKRHEDAHARLIAEDLCRLSKVVVERRDERHPALLIEPSHSPNMSLERAASMKSASAICSSRDVWPLYVDLLTVSKVDLG